MHKPIGIYAVGKFQHNITDSLPSLKERVRDVCGHNIRRVDRLTQLALIGACQCKNQITIPPQTALYVGSMYGALNNSMSVLKQMYHEALPPGPLKFVNTVGNAVCFYISQQLDLESSSLFISRSHFLLEACIKLARLDLSVQNAPSALIGLICEAGEPIEVHRQRLKVGNGPLNEVSLWLLLSYDMPGHRPIARIIDTKEPLHFTDLIAWIKIEITHHTHHKSLMFGPNVSLGKRKEIINHLDIPNQQADTFTQESSGALKIFDFIENKIIGPSLLIYIDTDNTNHWSTILIEK